MRPAGHYVGFEVLSAGARRGGPARHARPRGVHRGRSKVDDHGQLRPRRVERAGRPPGPMERPAPTPPTFRPARRFRCCARPTRPRWRCAGLRRRAAARRPACCPATRSRSKTRGYGSAGAHRPPDPDGRPSRPTRCWCARCSRRAVTGQAIRPTSTTATTRRPRRSWRRPTTTASSPARGFGLQRVYSDDRSLDETVSFGDRDCVLVPRGYHTVSAPPGYDLYYLNVMAGPKRQWAVVNDPDHEWRVAPSPAN